MQISYHSFLTKIQKLQNLKKKKKNFFLYRLVRLVPTGIARNWLVRPVWGRYGRYFFWYGTGGSSVPNYWPVRYIPAVPTGTVRNWQHWRQIHYEDCCDIDSFSRLLVYLKRHHNQITCSCLQLLTLASNLHSYPMLKVNSFMILHVSMGFKSLLQHHGKWSLYLGGKIPFKNIAIRKIERFCGFGRDFSRNSSLVYLF